MPGVAPDPRTRIFQWLELQPFLRQSNRAPVLDQSRSIRRYEMRHLVPLIHVPMEPEATIHRVYHPIATLLELDVVDGQSWALHSGVAYDRYWQTTTPSVVAGGSGALPT